MDNIHICCPKCSWEPDGHAYWRCSCLHVWDTFSTGGRCPKCRKVWDETQCILRAGGCGKWSPHMDWYQGLDDVITKLKEEILEKWSEPIVVTDVFRPVERNTEYALPDLVKMRT